MESINLLTNEFKSKGTNAKLASQLKIVGFVMLSLFVVAALVIAATFIITNREISRTKQSQKQLAESIKLIGDVENKYVLVKDRADKISVALGEPNSEENVEYFAGFLETLSEGIEISSISTESDTIEFSLNAANLTAISTVLETLRSEEEFMNIILDSFSFGNESGYTLDFTFEK